MSTTRAAVAAAAAIAVTLAIVPAALAAGQSVRVPHARGGVEHVYSVLVRDGFRVSIRHPFTVRSDATTAVTRITPRPGTRVLDGSVVTLSVRCCRRVVRTAPLAEDGLTVVPRMVGTTLQQTAAWVRTNDRRYRARLGPLHGARGPGLLGNYVVGSQSVKPDSTLAPHRVLALDARQHRSPICPAPYFSTRIARDTDAVLYAQAAGGYLTNYVGCGYRNGIERRLLTTDIAGSGATAVGTVALSGTRLAAPVVYGGGKYDATPVDLRLVAWDLSTGVRTGLWDAGAENRVSQLRINARGLAAWQASAGPAVVSTELTDVSCPSGRFCAASDAGGAVWTTADPTGGRSAWTETQMPTTALHAIACADPSLCVAGAGGKLFVSTAPTAGASAWQPVALPATFASVACPSAQLCVAVGQNSSVNGESDVAVSTNPADPSSWTVSAFDAPDAFVGSVRCPTTSLCVAGDAQGNILTSTDPAGGASTWTTGNVTANRHINGLACPSSALCIAGNDLNTLFATTRPAGGAQTWAPTASQRVGAISCGSDHLCVAGGNGQVDVTTDPTGPAAAWSWTPVTGFGAALGVSCSGTALCVAVDSSGDIASSANPTGGTSAWSSSAVDTWPCVASTGGCISEQILAHDHSGLRTLDVTGPGNGAQLQMLRLTDDHLTWTHDGNPESATLR